ncbi:enkurin [Clonorchis sinensis]|uniref:Enkurin n=1 Tax=Clonorchis sinensis TaxID=79923 RepID=G7YCG8_CLOSI|nr:enkurin [Clonorchis sinensis]
MNRIAAQKMPSKKAKRLLVDTRTGDKIDLPPSGLELVYVYKKKFGDVPDYLVQRAKAVALAKQQYSDYVKEMKRREALYQVSEEEKKNPKLSVQFRLHWHKTGNKQSLTIDP